MELISSRSRHLRVDGKLGRFLVESKKSEETPASVRSREKKINGREVLTSLRFDDLSLVQLSSPSSAWPLFPRAPLQVRRPYPRPLHEEVTSVCCLWRTGFWNDAVGLLLLTPEPSQKEDET